MQKQLIPLLVVFTVVLSLSSPAAVGAIGINSTKLPFGGFVRLTIPCTCSTGVLLIFDRVYVGAPAPISAVGLLYTPPKSKPYANFNAGTPSTWNLGSYTPGPAICLVGAPPVTPCVPVPVLSLGVVSDIGTSFPSFGAFGF